MLRDGGRERTGRGLVRLLLRQRAIPAIILALGPVSGAHLNPVVSLADGVLGGLTTPETIAYVGAPVVGAAVWSLYPAVEAVAGQVLLPHPGDRG